MLKIKYHSKFKKDIKIIKKRNYDLSKLEKVIEILAEEKNLPAKYKESFFDWEIIEILESVIFYLIGY